MHYCIAQTGRREHRIFPPTIKIIITNQMRTIMSNLFEVPTYTQEPGKKGAPVVQRFAEINDRQ
jgi:hypothetical protein